MGQAAVRAGLVLALAAAIAVSAAAQVGALTTSTPADKTLEAEEPVAGANAGTDIAWLIITPPGDKTFEATFSQTHLTTHNYGKATAHTNTGENIKITNDAPDTFPLGKTTITWVAETSTLRKTAAQTITVQDTRGPYLKAPPCYAFEATGALTSLSQDDYGAATAHDIASGVRSITNNAPSAGFPLGLTPIKYTATDNSNNETTRDGCVYVEDTTPPLITVPAPVLIEATGKNTQMNSTDYGVATATDLATANPTITSNATATFPVGTTPIEWVATDSSKNTSSGIQLITVVDTTPPTLTLPPVVVIEATAPKSQISDSDLGNVVVTDSADPAPVTKNDLKGGLGKGVHRIMWNATDDSGNMRWATQVVAVVDTTPPAVTAPRDILINSASPVPASLVSLGSASVVEAVGLSTPPTNDAPPTFPDGETTVTWTATDTSGIPGSATQKVTVDSNEIKLTIAPPNPAASWSDGFGSRLAHSGDLLFVSNTKYVKDGFKNAGAVHVYGIDDGVLDRTLHYDTTTQRVNQYFGGSIAIVDKSGSQDRAVAIGAKGHDANGKFVGSVQVFDVKTGTHLRTINNPVAYADSAPADAGMGDSFGAFTASLGDKIVIASHTYDDGAKSDVGRVYVHNVADGRLLYTIQNPADDADAGDMFGRRLAAFEDDTGEYVYVGTREHNGKKGAVLAFKLGTASAKWTATAVPGTSNTGYAFEAIVPDGSGGLFVGEPSIQSGTTLTGKVHHYDSDGNLSAVERHECCVKNFGSRLAVANGLLYVGDRHAKDNTGAITAYNATTGVYEGMFTNPGTARHFGFALEPLGNTLLAASEYASNRVIRVHILDLPSITGILLPSSSGASGTAGGASAPALNPPTLLSTSHGSGTVTLTYNVDIDPFEVDTDDYALGAAYAVVSADVSGKTVTLAYIAGAQAAPSPMVSTVGDLGLYAVPGGAQ